MMLACPQACGLSAKACTIHQTLSSLCRSDGHTSQPSSPCPARAPPLKEPTGQRVWMAPLHPPTLHPCGCSALTLPPTSPPPQQLMCVSHKSLRTNTTPHILFSPEVPGYPLYTRATNIANLPVLPGALAYEPQPYKQVASDMLQGRV